jgi:hypothetical protein
VKYFLRTEFIIGCAVATAATSCSGADDDSADDLVAQRAQARLAIEDGSVEPDDDSQVQVSSGDSACNPALVLLYGDPAALEAQCEAEALAESEDEVSWLPVTEHAVPVESSGAETPDPSILTEEDAAQHDDASADRAQE